MLNTSTLESAVVDDSRVVAVVEAIRLGHLRTLATGKVLSVEEFWEIYNDQLQRQLSLHSQYNSFKCTVIKTGSRFRHQEFEYILVEGNGDNTRSVKNVPIFVETKEGGVKFIRYLTTEGNKLANHPEDPNNRIVHIEIDPMWTIRTFIQIAFFSYLFSDGSFYGAWCISCITIGAKVTFFALRRIRIKAKEPNSGSKHDRNENDIIEEGIRCHISTLMPHSAKKSKHQPPSLFKKLSYITIKVIFVFLISVSPTFTIQGLENELIHDGILRGWN